MSVGPPEDYFEDTIGPDDAAMPTRPSERGAWRHHWDDVDDVKPKRPVHPVMPAYRTTPDRHWKKPPATSG